MRNLKTILPMLAFVLAIGMSFAFTTKSADAEEVVKIGGTTYEVSANCNGLTYNCRVQLIDQNGTPIPGAIHQVYGPDADGEFTVPLKSESAEPIRVSDTSLMPIE